MLVGIATAALTFQAEGQEPSPQDLPAQLLEQHAEDESICEPLANLRHRDEAAAYPLTNDFTLYLVPCAAGAYNFSHMLYVGPTGSPFFARQLFVDYTDRYGWTGVDQLYGVAFNLETLTLTSHYKGRRLDDCGTSGIWVWDEYAFRLVSFFAKSECDGAGGPGDFPQVWPPM